MLHTHWLLNLKWYAGLAEKQKKKVSSVGIIPVTTGETSASQIYYMEYLILS